MLTKIVGGGTVHTDKSTDASHNKKDKRSGDQGGEFHNSKSSKQSSNQSASTPKATCNTCGRYPHNGGLCNFDWHPNANKNEPDTPFLESAKGKSFFQACGLKFLTENKDEKGGVVNPPQSFKRHDKGSKGSSAGDNNTSGIDSLNIYHIENSELMVIPSDQNSYVSSNSTYIDSDNLLSVSLFVCQDTRKGAGERVDKSAFGKALLDPGSLAGNFVNDKLLVSLLGVDVYNSVDGPTLPVCSGLDNVCYNVSNKSYKLNVSS